MAERLTPERRAEIEADYPPPGGGIANRTGVRVREDICALLAELAAVEDSAASQLADEMRKRLQAERELDGLRVRLAAGGR